MKVFEKKCKNCLFSNNSIVDLKRKKDIVNDCVKEQSHFVCHKASMEGLDICCYGFYEKLGHVSQNIRIAERLNAIKFVELKNDIDIKKEK